MSSLPQPSELPSTDLPETQEQNRPTSPDLRVIEGGKPSINPVSTEERHHQMSPENETSEVGKNRQADNGPRPILNPDPLVAGEKYETTLKAFYDDSQNTDPADIEESLFGKSLDNQ